MPAPCFFYELFIVFIGYYAWKVKKQRVLANTFLMNLTIVSTDWTGTLFISLIKIP